MKPVLIERNHTASFAAESSGGKAPAQSWWK